MERSARVSKRPIALYQPEERVTKPKGDGERKKTKRDRFEREYVPYDPRLMNYLFTNYKDLGIESFVVDRKGGQGGQGPILTNRVFVYRPNVPSSVKILRNFGTKEDYKDPGGSISKRTILPPDLEEWEVQVFQGRIHKPECHFIAIPLVMIGERTKRVDPEMTKASTMKWFDFLSYKEKPDGEHTVVLLYNKATRDIEVLDDTFMIHQLFFNYKMFLKTDLKHFIGPILKTFGLEVNNVYLPIIKEKRKGLVQGLLKERGFPTDFDAIYKTYLANYLRFRMLPEYREVPYPVLAKGNVVNLNEPVGTAEGRGTVKPEGMVDSPEVLRAYIDAYVKLSEFKGENPAVSRYIPLVGTEGKAFDFYKPCPEGFVRSFVTGLCEPEESEVAENLDVLERFHETGKNFYPKHAYVWFTLMMRHFMDKHRHLAVIQPDTVYYPHPYHYAIRYNQVKRVPGSKSKSSMEFSIPTVYGEFIKKAMNDVSKTLVVMFVAIDYKGTHSNPLIIDKLAGTVERIEVNAPMMDYSYGYNDLTLDEKLKDLVENHPDMKEYGLRYIPALEACPYGLHRAEYMEVTENVKDIGGRCAEWSIYYMDLRASNPTIPREKLYSYALERIKKTGSVKHFIAGYMNELVKMARKYRDVEYTMEVKGPKGPKGPEGAEGVVRKTRARTEKGLVESPQEKRRATVGGGAGGGGETGRLSLKTVVIPYLDRFRVVEGAYRKSRGTGGPEGRSGSGKMMLN